MKKSIFGLLIFTAFLYSCNKDIECDNAQICIVNNTGDTVMYAWGSNHYEDTLLPNQKACRNVGPVTITRNSASYSTVYFDCTKGSYYYDVTDCYEEHSLD